MGCITNKPYRDPGQDGFSGGRTQGPDTESGWVGEISSMFDILLIHHNKPGKCNLS